MTDKTNAQRRIGKNQLAQSLRKEALNSWIGRKFDLVQKALRQDDLDLLDCEEIQEAEARIIELLQ